MILFLIAMVFVSCNKEDDTTDNTGDPSNLTVEVLSIDHEAGVAEIQANADNAVLYEFYIDDATSPEESNNTGFLAYAFEDKTFFTVTVRAYGSSGRYIKETVEVQVDEGGGSGPVPIDRGYTTPLEYAGYSLVWQDEFSGNSINSSFWGFDTGNNNGWGNNELEYYRIQNAWVANEVLTIEAREEYYQGFNYTSAKLKTKGKKSFQYGRIDIRALMPEGQGMWPALWTLGNDINSVSWPNCGEIDIMEMKGGSDREKTVYGTAHWDSGGNNASYGKTRTLPSEEYNLAEAYHVFTIIWDENSIKWFLDDQQYNVLDITGSTMSEFHQAHWFIFNVAVGGNFPGSPDATTVFPQQMKVDYIRVFQPN